MRDDEGSRRASQSNGTHHAHVPAASSLTIVSAPSYLPKDRPFHERNLSPRAVRFTNVMVKLVTAVELRAGGKAWKVWESF